MSDDLMSGCCGAQALVVSTGEEDSLGGGPVFRLASLDDAVWPYPTECIKPALHDGEHYDGHSLWWPGNPT